MKDRLIPAYCSSFNYSNAEEKIYNAFRSDHANKGYTIIYSLMLRFSEADFLILHKDKGILLIETKSGFYRYNNNEITGADKKDCKIIINPTNQLNKCKASIDKLLADLKSSNMLSRNINISKCIWLPDSRPQNFDGIPDKNIYFFEDISQENIKMQITEFWDTALKNNPTNQSLSEEEYNIIVNALAPNFRIDRKSNWRWKRTNALQKEYSERQNIIIPLLKEQNNVIFCGAAGTGKTVLALEKAKTLAAAGKDVFFICFNDIFREKTKEAFINSSEQYNEKIKEKVKFINLYEYYGIHYITEEYGKGKYYISDNDTALMSTQEVSEYFREQISLQKPFTNVIIDEAQDFNRIVLSALFESASANNGIFYAFYDENQSVNYTDGKEWLAQKHPDTMHIVLFDNLRNTEKIVFTAKSQYDRTGYDRKTAPGIVPGLWLCDSGQELETAGRILNSYSSQEINTQNTAVLTMKGWTDYNTKNPETITIGNHLLAKDEKLNYYSDGNIIFTTARTFKGMEANSVIVIDADKYIFSQYEEQYGTNKSTKDVFYTACSRACTYLDVVIANTEELQNFFGKSQKELPAYLAEILKMELHQ